MSKIIDIARKNIIFCSDTDTVDIIAKIMVDHNIGSVFVRDGDAYVGIIDDRMLFRLLIKGENPIPKKASEIMVPLEYINEDLEIEEAWEEMEKANTERFAVINEDKDVVGIVKKKTIGYLRLKNLKEKLGIIDI